MVCSTPGFPVHHQLPELAQTHVHRVSDAIQLSGECMLLGSVSSQQIFGVMDIKALSASQLSGLGQTML